MANAKRAHARGKRATKIARGTGASVRRKSISSRVRKDPKPAFASLRRGKHKGGPVAGTPSPMRTRLSAALQAHARRQFEETDRYVTDIALDCGVDESVLRRMALREGWERYVPPPRDLPPVAKLLAEVEALEAVPPVTPEERVAAIDRLHREAMSQLAEVEALRAHDAGGERRRAQRAHAVEPHRNGAQAARHALRHSRSRINP